jgi:hypothetical protein
MFGAEQAMRSVMIAVQITVLIRQAGVDPPD